MNKRLLLIDAPYYVHRAYNVVLYRKDPKHIERNTLSTFLSMVASDVVSLRATHVALTFDGDECWRYAIYPEYKANRRNKSREDFVLIEHPKYRAPVKVTTKAADCVPSARILCQAAGFKTFRNRTVESDDLLGSLVHQFKDIKGLNIVVSARDKDMAGLVCDNVKQYWPSEKKWLDANAVKEHYGVHPFQMRDYLALTGDHVDNIPGVPGIAGKTAAKILASGTLKERLSEDPDLRKKLAPNRARLAMAQKLVTLKLIDVPVELEDLTPQKPNKDKLMQMVWSIPKNLSDVHAAAKAATMKGLFR